MHTHRTPLPGWQIAAALAALLLVYALAAITDADDRNTARLRECHVTPSHVPPGCAPAPLKQA